MRITLSQLVALFAGFMVMLVNGSLYVYGTMTPYIFTFLHYKGMHLFSKEQHHSTSATSPSSSPSLSSSPISEYSPAISSLSLSAIGSPA